jgi:selenocysteine lyase/cysteine desulfurase
MTAQNRPEKGSGHGSSSPQDDTDTGILDRWCQIEDDAVASLLAAPPPAFGAAMRRAHFPALGACGPGALLSTRPTEHYLNQGGTGLVMEPILRLRELTCRLAEEQPMCYHREIAPVLMRRARAHVARYLGAESPRCISFMASASSGFYAVLRATTLVAGDLILTTSLRYHSFDDDLQRYCAAREVVVVTVDIPLPIASHEQIMAAFEATVAELQVSGSLQRLRLAFIDHVSSKPAVLLPVAKICAMFRGKFRYRSIHSCRNGASRMSDVPAESPGVLTARCWYRGLGILIN